MKQLKLSLIGTVLFSAVIFPMTIFSADEKPAGNTSNDADALVKAHLPPASQHVFVPVDPAWQAQIAYHKLRPDAFVNVDKPSDEEKKKLYKEVRYFEGLGNKDPSGAIKIFEFYPNGATYREIDDLPNEEFCRRFYPNGQLRDYSHWQNGKWIAGLAVDPVSKKANYFANGSGSLTTFDILSNRRKTEWYRDGSLFFSDRSSDGKRDEVELYVGNDSLRSNSEKEELQLSSQSEIWRRPSGSDPQFDYIYPGRPGVFVPKNTDVRSIPPMGGPPERQKRELDQILQEWKIAYPKRRKTFLDQWEKILANSGQTWKSLNIEFIREDAAWPK
jgi:hypothetical protein